MPLMSQTRETDMKHRKLVVSDDGTVVAPPHTATWCDECGVWVFCDAAPFGENDRTKWLRDIAHVDAHHPDAVVDAPAVNGAAVVSVAWSPSNTEPVNAIVEDVRVVGGRAVVVGVNYPA